ncbi:hypothetical protein WMF30_43975 [Sorangium sp. So ce134]
MPALLAARRRGEVSRAARGRAPILLPAERLKRAPMRELSAEERAEIVGRLARGGLLDAVAYHRRATGASLADALASVRALAREEGLLAEAASGGGLSATIYAVGPFRAELVPFFDYSAELYAGVAPGAPLIQCLFDVYESTRETFALAAAFGADPLDFNTHALDASRADLEALRGLEPEGLLVERFLALRDAGFRFYFFLQGPEAGSDGPARESG